MGLVASDRSTVLDRPLLARSEIGQAAAVAVPFSPRNGISVLSRGCTQTKTVSCPSQLRNCVCVTQ